VEREEPGVARVVHGIATGLAILSGVGVLLLMATVVLDVGRRELLGPSLRGAIEVSEVALVVVVFGAFMSAEARKTHIRTPILTSRLPHPWGDVARLVGLLCVLTLLVTMTVLTLRAGIASMLEREFRFGLARVPIWPAKLVIPLGLAGLTLEHVLNTVVVARRIRQRPVEEEEETE
jgi:TRAP-type C4-dicarboxylate transport system permease small subunit